jgi:hypothetical protein
MPFLTSNFGIKYISLKLGNGNIRLLCYTYYKNIPYFYVLIVHLKTNRIEKQYLDVYFSYFGDFIDKSCSEDHLL